MITWVKYSPVSFKFHDTNVQNLPHINMSRKKYRATQVAEEANGPIVLRCKQLAQKDHRKLEILLGIRHYKESFLRRYFSIVITRFQIKADFSSGRVESSAPTNTLSTVLGESIQRTGFSEEIERQFGPEISNNSFKLLAALKSKRASQTQQEFKRGIKVIEILSTVPSDKVHEITWLVKLHSPVILAQYLMQDKDQYISVLDYYTGTEKLSAKAEVASDAHNTIVEVIVDCDSILFLKNRSDSKFSAFWESVVFFETRAKRKLEQRYSNFRKGAYMKCTLQ